MLSASQNYALGNPSAVFRVLFFSCADSDRLAAGDHHAWLFYVSEAFHADAQRVRACRQITEDVTAF